MRIAQVAEEYDISADTLRYYERIGLLRPIARTSAGVREYAPEDCARIQFIKCMRGAGVAIEPLIEYMNLLDEGDGTLAARKEILERQRELTLERMEVMQAGLDRLDYKIAHYDELLGRGASAS